VVREAIAEFLESAARPVLIEPGEDPLPICADKFGFALSAKSGADSWSWKSSVLEAAPARCC